MADAGALRQGRPTRPIEWAAPFQQRQRALRAAARTARRSHRAGLSTSGFLERLPRPKCCAGLHASESPKGGYRQWLIRRARRSHFHPPKATTLLITRGSQIDRWNVEPRLAQEIEADLCSAALRLTGDAACEGIHSASPITRPAPASGTASSIACSRSSPGTGGTSRC